MIQEMVWASLLFCVFVSAGFAQTADSTATKQPVAMVERQAIYYDDLLPTIRAQMLRLRSQEYEIKKKALDALIDQRLLEIAAKKKGITPERLIEQEVSARIPVPTDAELRAYYLGQKDRLNHPFEHVKDQLRHTWMQERIQEGRQEYLRTLRKGEVLVLLRPPKVQVGYDPARLRGDPSAPVMIVEFSDFECPYCREVEPTLKDLLSKYGKKVSLAYRDMPLTQLHPQAEAAAEAARCAGEQGKFWEYHDQLFNASNLQEPALLDYARTLKMDDKQFHSCLSSEKYKAKIQRDLQDGTQAGVAGTPGFFINGIPFSGARSVDSFVDLIEEELARTK